ncbi:hypothetical protein ASZ78_007326 [Callipepla squamata]|uniref:Uncharacterized protein n=1 Tax=Callipepla squamata TaxID=9009 RepID=A0A226NGW1_CALSU|nr:hypothetical protein ASZ78_007326 [Callipepla squamata]
MTLRLLTKHEAKKNTPLKTSISITCLTSKTAAWASFREIILLLCILFRLLNKICDNKELTPEHGPHPGDTLDQWVSAFLVYASVVCEKHPARCGAMFKYLDTIRKLHATYGGTSWMNYDEDFRRRAAKDPNLPWGDVDLDLWMKWMAPLKSLLSRHNRMENEPQAAPPAQPPPSSSSQSPKKEEKSQV